MPRPTPEQIAHMKAHASDDKRIGFILLNIVFLVIAYCAVGLRYLSRHRQGTKIGKDDILISVALILVTGHAVGMCVATHFGMGRRGIFVTDFRSLAITATIAQCFYNTSIPAIKISILFLYGRIFQRTVGWLTPSLYITGAFVVAYSIAQAFVYLFRCVPISSLWTLDDAANAVCLDFRTAIIVFGIINIVTDWLILALPIPVVLGLRVERKTKWTLCALFVWGGLVCIVSIIRLFFARHVSTSEPSWDNVPISQISTVECASGILAACMPTYRPLFKFVGSGLGSFFSTNRGKSSNNSKPPSGLNYPLDTLNTKRSSILVRYKGKLPTINDERLGKRPADTLSETASEERILGRDWEVTAGKSSFEGDPELAARAEVGSGGRDGPSKNRKEVEGIVVTKTIATVTDKAENK